MTHIWSAAVSLLVLFLRSVMADESSLVNRSRHICRLRLFAAAAGFCTGGLNVGIGDESSSENEIGLKYTLSSSNDTSVPSSDVGEYAGPPTVGGRAPERRLSELSWRLMSASSSLKP